jgi:imidazoleglycerol-phosphate dehydratase
MERKKTIKRKTKETEIELELDIDGKGDADIKIPVPFLCHMLESFAKHGCFDLKIKATGDVETDPHHLIEDAGVCLGSAIAGCTGDKTGIRRFGFAIIPMDEAEVTVSLDLGGRSYLRYCADMLNENIGNMSSVLVEDFFRAVADNASINIHINKNAGVNSHHIIEAMFKAFGVALMHATRTTGMNTVLSTKGLL